MATSIRPYLRDRDVIYFIRDVLADAVKVGYTRKPVGLRLKQLQTGNPGELVLLGVIPGSRTVESEIHDHLRPHRIRGEWFKLSDVVSLQIESIIEDGWPIP